MSRFRRNSQAVVAVVAAALMLSACAAGGGAADDQKEEGKGKATVLNVGTSGSPKPYTFVGDDNQLTGYDIEILKKIDEKLDDIDFDYQVAEFPALFAGLDSGRFDIVANNLSATKERREKYDFTDPYIEAQFGVALPAAQKNAKLSTIDDLAGKKTYGTPGLNYTKILEQYNAAHPDNPVEIEYTELDLQLQFQNLAAGLVDFIFIEQVAYDGYGPKAGLDVAFTTLDNKYLVDTFGTNLYSAFAFSKAKDHSAELEKINNALKELLADGTVAELSKKYFGGLDVTPKQ